MESEWDWDSDEQYLGENLPADTLDRKKYAKHLYEICAARGEKSNLVININAEWGAGKTYFTKRLAKTIAEKHPTIYIDAWKEDFSDDPLLTVFSSIKEQLTGQSDKFTTLINKTIENIGPLLKTATPVLIDGLVRKFIGIDSVSELTKDLSSKLLEIHSEKSTKVETIRKGISTWVNFISRKDCINKELPIFIIIDELDRCRPNFAINLLEITKHIFNIPGVVFMIATDTEQLQHSIKVVYGNDFSASHYLSRFFDRRFLLPSPDLKNLLLTKSADSILSEQSSLQEVCAPSHPSLDSFMQNCSGILCSLNINLRDAIKIYERLIDIILTTTKKLDPNLMLILLAVNFKNYAIYSKIKNGDMIESSSFLFHVSIVFDLSYSKTGVRTLSSSRGFVSNSNDNIKNIKTDVISYINNARIVLSTPLTRLHANVQSNIVAGWLNGDLSVEENLDNFLKMGFASSKMNKSELKIHQYFDLIELSTTFD